MADGAAGNTGSLPPPPTGEGVSDEQAINDFVIMLTTYKVVFDKISEDKEDEGE